ncbi:GNAT family N-acetyltransferase [Oceanihabitans sediminis]|uniref:N-acetyltransferase n=1 Tax=Oceanihabitans sediminis TaxID=1812012 RepID=A0A368P4K3_9FLAO|nr:GNAT family N-acetyltransferase [Oceanihabitans sediminis]MDX1278342.1 GNAT family N-acetyltransferase [Oceanihabitans sediminis]MDX1773347.1 GNAT family N-acetyltransferase [Oceanihabitans sediminis]RCU57807.1 N-acetyltransferase [Oceanihabitans sediminis]
MKTEYIDIPLVKNEEKKRFEINIDGHFAFINYGEFGNQIALVHTEAEPELAGKGAASAVVEKTLQYLDENNISLLPFCPYVFAYIKKHPEWKRIVSPKFKGYDKL